MAEIAFWISILASVSNLSIMLFSFVTHKFQYWPPASPRNWMYHLFWMLWRISGIGLLILSYFEFQNRSDFSLLNWIGIAIFVLGMTVTILAGLNLGIAKTKGRNRDGLNTEGLYSLSRNPQYVGAYVWIIGWMLFSFSVPVTIALMFIGAGYLLCPVMEEPWLERTYGEDYRHYKSKVPRFILK